MEPELIQAAKQRDSSHLRRLILAGQDLDQCDDQGETALTWAAHLGHTPIVKDLLAAGARVGVRGRRFKANPLQLAASGGHRGIVALLAVHGDVNAGDDRGATPLLRVFDHAGGPVPARKVTAVVEVLLMNEADPNIPDLDGRTPLMAAALIGNLEAAQSLLAAGAEKDAENSRGETALDLAKNANQLDVAALLES